MKIIVNTALIVISLVAIVVFTFQPFDNHQAQAVQHGTQDTLTSTNTASTR